MLKIRRGARMVNMARIARLPQFVECGCCGMWHRDEWDGDCRNDKERLSLEQIYEKHGYYWREVGNGFERNRMRGVLP